MITTPLPEFTPQMSTDDKIKMLLDNYYMLRKEIGYGFSNLGMDNFTSTVAKSITKNIDGLDALSQEVYNNSIEFNEALTGIYTNIGGIQTVIQDGMIITYYQDAEPIGKLGDLWFNTLTKKSYRHNGTVWKLIEDAGIASAIELANTAQDTADGKIVSYYTPTEPTGKSIGDLWIDIDDKNHLYRFDGAVWVDIRDGAIEVVSSNLNNAIAALNSSMSDMQTAIEDKMIVTFYQELEPTTQKVGDLWFNTTTKKLNRYSSSGWQLIEDAGIIEAVELAQNAQTTADGKIVSYYQDEAPTSGAVGDLWVDTNDGNKLHRYNGTTWIVIQDAKINQVANDLNNAVTAINSSLTDLSTAIADGMIVTYYQATTPTTAKIGDLWFNTSTTIITVNDDIGLVNDDDGTIISLLDSVKKLFRYNGTIWEPIQDDGVIAAIKDAQNAQDTADGKIVSFYQNEMPTDGTKGDLWIDTNDNNKLYRHNGTTFINVRDKLLESILNTDGNVMAEKIAGILNTAVTLIKNSTSTITIDGDDILIHDQPTKEASTMAMKLSSAGLAIANAKDTNGDWVWRTAITGEGISADEITTGILTAIIISGVTISGSDITSENDNAKIRLFNGVLSLLDKASTAQFNINYREGLPQGVLQSELELYNEFKASNPSKPANNTMSLNSLNSHMGIELGNGAVSLGNDWVKMTMYGGTFNWLEAYPTYADWESRGFNPPPTTAQGAKLVIDLISSIWAFQPGWGLASSSIDINLSNECWINLKASLDVRGDFEVHGTKDCVIETEEYGKLHFGAYETPEYYFGDIGENEVIDGICTINLDERLTRCVNTEISYQVFLTPYGDGRVYVEQRNATNFVIKGDNIKFGWEVKAKRKNYENVRFGQGR